MRDKFVTLYLSVRLSYTWQITQKSAMTNTHRHKLPETQTSQAPEIVVVVKYPSLLWGVSKKDCEHYA